MPRSIFGTSVPAVSTSPHVVGAARDGLGFVIVENGFAAPCPGGMVRSGSYPYDCYSTAPPPPALIALAGVFVVGIIALGFYQAKKGIRPVYYVEERRPMMFY